MSRPLRILQVVSQLGPTGGGVEVWLLQILRRIDLEQFRMDFLVHTLVPGAFDDEVRSLGSRVLTCVRPLHLWKYPFAFRQALRAGGPYDVVHSHVLFAGLVLRLARRAGVPMRIAHSHSDVEGFRVDGDPFRGPFVRYTNRWLRRDATCRLACSRRAAAALFGPGEDVARVVYYGIDLKPFAEPVDRAAVRAELGLPPDAWVVGHVGRFQEQKNHGFLVEVAAALARRQPRLVLLLIGDGPLRPTIEQQVRQAGLTERIRFLGVRPDVPRLMRGALDVFVLPSRYEGLPLAGLEAQAAGLPCVFSDVISEELDVVPGLVRRVSLAWPADKWAAAVLGARPTVPQQEALATMWSSPFNIENAVRRLEEVYRECVGEKTY